MRLRRWSTLRPGCPCPRQQPTRENTAPQASPPRQTRQPTPATTPEDTPSTHATSPRRGRRRGAAAAWPGQPSLGFPPVLEQGMDMAMTTPPRRRRRPQTSSLPAATLAHGFLRPCSSSLRSIADWEGGSKVFTFGHHHGEGSRMPPSSSHRSAGNHRTPSRSRTTAPPCRTVFRGRRPGFHCEDPPPGAADPASASTSTPHQEGHHGPSTITSRVTTHTPWTKLPPPP